MKTIYVLFKKQLKNMMMNKQIFVMLLFSILYPLGMKALMPAEATSEMPSGFLIGFGVLFCIGMVAPMMMAYPLAEEKEKNTLRVLMTSGVRPVDYLVGSMLATGLVSMIACVIILFTTTSGQVNLFYYLIGILSATIPALICGAVIGLVCKTQMSTGLLMVPISLPLILIPMFSALNSTLEKISNFLFTGQLMNFLAKITEGEQPFTLQFFLVMIATTILLGMIFVITYRKNKFD